MKIKVKEIYPVFAWSWDTDSTAQDIYYNNPKYNQDPNINDETYTFLKNYRNDEDDVCGICRVSYNGICPSCKIPGKSCPLVVGSCNHSFHYHCIYRWLDTPTSKGLCPMCRQEFKLKSNVVINAPHVKKFEILINKNRERRLLLENEEEINNEILEEGAQEDNEMDDDNVVTSSNDDSAMLVD